MAIKDNFGNPKGLIGKIMLFGMNQGHTPMANWAFTQFDVPSEGKFLDVGCGGGYNIKRLLEKSTNAFVYGADISETSVKQSEKVNKKFLDSRCKVFVANAIKLPFVDNELNLVTAFETVYFWKDIEKCFSEIYRILNSNGRFIIVNDPGDPNKHWDEMIEDMTSYKAEELEEFMRNAGFNNVQVTTSKYKVCVIGTK